MAKLLKGMAGQVPAAVESTKDMDAHEDTFQYACLHGQKDNMLILNKM
jgi:hypothetical protein